MQSKTSEFAGEILMEVLKLLSNKILEAKVKGEAEEEERLQRRYIFLIDKHLGWDSNASLTHL